MLRLTVLIFIAFSQAAMAAPVKLTYAVFGGGLHIVNGSLTYSENKSSYSAEVFAATQGVLSKLAPWRGHVLSSGLKGDKAWTPQRHEFTTEWRDDAKTVLMNYDKKGAITERIVREKGEKEDRKSADPILAKNAMDMPTGILNFLRHRDMGKGCEGQFPVYDGKRRFNVILSGQRSEIVAPSRYSAFSGPAISCILEIQPDGGEWSKKKRGWYRIQEDSRTSGRLPRIFIAPLKGVGDWLVPVRLDVASPYGAFVMHLTGTSGSVK